MPCTPPEPLLLHHVRHTLSCIRRTAIIKFVSIQYYAWLVGDEETSG